MPCSDSHSDSDWKSLGGWPIRLSWVWLAVPFFGVLIRISLAPIAPNDYWWHLTAARFFEQTGRLLDANYFLYTLPADRGFLNQPWLSQWLMYEIWQLGGHAATAVSNNVLAGLTWFGVFAVGVTRCRDVRVFGAFAMLTVAVAGSVFGVRTQMFALPLFVGGFGLVVGVADGRIDAWWLWGLVPVTVLWANLHGSFLLLPLLTGLTGGVCFLEGMYRGSAVGRSDLWHWGGATGGMFAAACLNPHGWDVYAYVVRLAIWSSVPETVTEWQPPDPSEPVGAAIWVGLVVSGGLLAWRRRKVAWWEAAVFAATAWLAATSLRSVFWWEVAALWIVPRHLADLLEVGGAEARRSTGMIQGFVHAAFVVALAGMTVVIQPGTPWHGATVKRAIEGAKPSGEGAYILNDKNPLELVRHIRIESSTQSARVFHHQAVGGLLGFRLGFDTSDGDSGEETPEAVTRSVAFVDQRMEMIPQSVWDDYFAFSTAAKGWERRLRERGVNWLLLYRSENDPGEQRGLIDAARRSDGWRQARTTERWRLFERSSLDGSENTSEQKITDDDEQ